MNKKRIKLIISIALFIFIIVIFSTSIYAAGLDPDDENWIPSTSINGRGAFIIKAGKVLGWIRYIGIIVGLIALTIIGLKYMFSSVEGKAEYKKTMMPYLIGCFMVIGISLIMTVIGSISTGTPSKVTDKDRFKDSQVADRM